jgi:hypothetical protein
MSKKKTYRKPPQITKKRGRAVAYEQRLFIHSTSEARLREQLQGYVRYALEQRAVVELANYNYVQKCLIVTKTKI